MPPLPHYVFMAWCLVKYRDNFTFSIKFSIHMLKFFKQKYSKVHIGENLLDAFLLQNVLNQGDTLLVMLFNFFRVCHQKGPRKWGRYGIEWITSALVLCWFKSRLNSGNACCHSVPSLSSSRLLPRSCEHNNEPLGSRKSGEFLDHLNDS